MLELLAWPLAVAQALEFALGCPGPVSDDPVERGWAQQWPLVLVEAPISPLGVEARPVRAGPYNNKQQKKNARQSQGHKDRKNHTIGRLIT